MKKHAKAALLTVASNPVGLPMKDAKGIRVVDFDKLLGLEDEPFLSAIEASNFLPFLGSLIVLSKPELIQKYGHLEQLLVYLTPTVQIQFGFDIQTPDENDLHTLITKFADVLERKGITLCRPNVLLLPIGIDVKREQQDQHDAVRNLREFIFRFEQAVERFRSDHTILANLTSGPRTHALGLFLATLEAQFVPIYLDPTWGDQQKSAPGKVPIWKKDFAYYAIDTSPSDVGGPSLFALAHLG